MEETPQRHMPAFQFRIAVPKTFEPLDSLPDGEIWPAVAVLLMMRDHANASSEQPWIPFHHDLPEQPVTKAIFALSDAGLVKWCIGTDPATGNEFAFATVN